MKELSKTLETIYKDISELFIAKSYINPKYIEEYYKDRSKLKIWLFSYQESSDTLLHWTLYPENTKEEDTIKGSTVRFGSGSIGFVLRSKKGEIVNNTFDDPRGTVSLEDEYIGNKSWFGIPVINSEGNVKCIISFFYNEFNFWKLNVRKEIIQDTENIISKYNIELLLLNDLYLNEKLTNIFLKKPSSIDFIGILPEIDPVAKDLLKYSAFILLSGDNGSYKIENLHLNTDSVENSLHELLNWCSISKNKCNEKCLFDGSEKETKNLLKIEECFYARDLLKHINPFYVKTIEISNNFAIKIFLNENLNEEDIDIDNNLMKSLFENFIRIYKGNINSGNYGVIKRIRETIAFLGKNVTEIILGIKENSLEELKKDIYLINNMIKKNDVVFNFDEFGNDFINKLFNNLREIRDKLKHKILLVQFWESNIEGISIISVNDSEKMNTTYKIKLKNSNNYEKICENSTINVLKRLAIDTSIETDTYQPLITAYNKDRKLELELDRKEFIVDQGDNNIFSIKWEENKNSRTLHGIYIHPTNLGKQICNNINNVPIKLDGRSNRFTNEIFGEQNNILKFNKIIPLYPKTSNEKNHRTIAVGLEKEIDFSKINILEQFTRNLYFNVEKIIADLLYKKSTLKTAIISILVDSFAHNISAHSLSAIVWLYMQRNSISDKRFFIEQGEKLQNNLIQIPMENDIETISNDATDYYDNLGFKDSTYNEDYFSINDILNYLDNSTLEKLFTFHELRTDKTNDKLTSIPQFTIPLDNEMIHFLKYLKEKSAFWNGVSRDVMYGGETKNWYEVIYEFSNNPLYLGTIAHSEGINKVDINLEYYFGDEKKLELLNFMTIDISNLMQNNFKLSPKNYISLGGKYKTIREVLSKYSVFLPGGIVGKHSLYTIFENTMRNIKHSKDRDKITFNIFIKLKEDKKIYDLTIWLSNKTDLTDSDVDSINKITYDSIMTDNGKPKLGGNSQDKICSAMLFTNKFSEVENKTIKYPWIQYPDLDKKKSVKRQFSLWKGEDYIKLRNDLDLIDENISRFIFSIVFKDSSVSKKDISENGIIRKIDFDDFEPSEMKKMIKNNNSYEISPKKKKQIKDLLYRKWNNDWIKFSNKDEIKIGIIEKSKKYTLFSITNENENWIIKVKKEKKIDDNKINIFFTHGEKSENIKNDVLQYRNHGPLIEKFLNMGDHKIRNENMDEFIESLLTKVLIIDNRIYDRISKYSKIDLFNNCLFLTVKNEKNKDFKNLKNNIKNGNYNFVILHLSYIESLESYNETNINEFVENLFENQIFNKNTKFIITTGRGRDRWRESVEQKDYYEHIMLKPIDMLLDSIQDGLIFKDDFMVKYNLLKSIFGS